MKGPTSVTFAVLALSLAGSVALVPDTADGAVTAAVDLQPHRAVYSLSLADQLSMTGVAAARGAMVFEWADACDTWTIRQEARFDIFGPEGRGVRTEVLFSSWEDKIGTRYGYSLRTRQDGRVVETMRGSATLDGPGGAGAAEYAEPAVRTLPLPKGTLFPSSHTIDLIRNARAGERFVSVPVFLGQRDDEPMLVTAVIGEADAAAADRPLDAPGMDDAARALLAGPAWSFNLAFFGADGSDLPAFEIREDVHANGIVETATVTYRDFAFRYTLERLEALPAPRC